MQGVYDADIEENGYAGGGRQPDNPPAAFSDRNRYLDVEVESDDLTYRPSDTNDSWNGQDWEDMEKRTGAKRRDYSRNAERWAPVADAGAQDDWD
jgi:hypothetical protein